MSKELQRVFPEKNQTALEGSPARDALEHGTEIHTTYGHVATKLVEILTPENGDTDPAVLASVLRILPPVGPFKSVRFRTPTPEVEKLFMASFNATLDSFVQAYDSQLLDASLLMLPLVGFLPADDPRVRSTVHCIEQRLVDSAGFVLRYDSAVTDDGLPEGEGSFLACSFWLADAYVMMGRYDDAERLFERLVSLSNDLGLLSEEYDARRGRLCGNFPQGFTHLALVSTAFNLGKSRAGVETPPEQRGGKE